jgi:DNA polymerase-1
MIATLSELQTALAVQLGSPTAAAPPERPSDTPEVSTPTPEPPGTKLMVQRLTALVREVSTLGVKFHVQGPHLTITGAEGLPVPLANRLDEYERSGWLHGYFGCDRHEEPALALLKELRVRPHLIETRQLLRRAVRRLILDRREHGPELGFDIETAAKPEYRKLPPAITFTQDGVIAERQGPPRARGALADRTLLDPYRARIASAQLYAGGEHAFVVRGPALSMLLSSHWFRRQHLVAHNAAFEASFLAMVPYCLPPGRRPIAPPMECTMQAVGLEIGCRRSALGGRALDNAARVLWKIAVDKSLAVSDWGAAQLSPGQIAYAASDAVLAYDLWKGLRPKLKAPLPHGQNRWTAYTLQRDAIPSVVRMQNRGLLLDREEHAKQVEQWSRELAEARHTYHESTGKPPPSNDNETRAWLESMLSPGERLNWPRTGQGLLSIRHNDLARVADVPNAKTIMKIREKQTELKSFGESLVRHINPVTRRIHGDFSIAAAGPGRFAAANPNVQQFPVRRSPGFRRCIIAAPGHLLVTCDWSMIELRALAWLYQDDALMTDLVEHDIHARTAARINGIAPEAVTKSQRASAKAVNFGSIYGISADGLKQSVFADFGIVLTSAQAQNAIDQFAHAYHCAWEGRERFAKVCLQRGYIVVPTSGRLVRREWQWSGRLTARQCFNTPVQGSCADALLRAMTLIDTCLIDAGIRGGLIGTVHDELILEVHEDDADLARNLLEVTMVEAFATTFPGAPTKGVAEAAIGRSWAEAKA